MASIVGFAELITLSESIADFKKNQDHAEHILQASTQLFELLENLLKWAKEQQNGMILKPQNLDTYRIVKNSIQLLHIMSSAKNITVENNLNRSHHIYADVVTFNTVVRNLLSNAIKFTPDGGKIEVYSKRISDTIEIYFKDSGIGIEPEDITKLFDPDIDRSTIGKDQPNKGIGLGLILCRDFIKQNNGFIHVDSQPNEGSTFIITLPIAMSIDNTL